MSESRSCNSGSQLSSWLTKSCFPNSSNQHPNSILVDNPIPVSLIKTTNNNTIFILSLPDDLLLEILSRLPNHTFSSISLVCRRWSHLLHSPSFHHHRRLHNRLSLSIFALSLSSSLLISSHSLTLLHSPWTTFNITKPYIPLSHARLVAVGPIIYIITGRTTMLAYHTWTHTVSPKPGMRNTIKKFAAAVFNAKIYISGGACRTNAVEEYDPHAQTWQVLSPAPRKRYGCIGASVDGVFYIIGGLKIGACESRAVTLTEANGYPSSMDLYDVEAREWLRSQAVPGGGCVVAACGSGMYLYVLASHAVELSFWRFNGCRLSERYKEWCRIKAPPLPAQVRLDRSVRFICIGMGDKVVLVQVLICIDDLLTRGRRITRGYQKDGLVLVFDSATDEWSRATDLPEVITREFIDNLYIL